MIRDIKNACKLIFGLYYRSVIPLYAGRKAYNGLWKTI